MPVKLIENVVKIEESKYKPYKKGIKESKKLKESYDYSDFFILQSDEALESMMNNASDEDINSTIKVFNFIKSQFKVPRIDDFLYVRVSDELQWELEDLSDVKNMKSFKGSEVQILQMETEDFGTIVFAEELADVGSNAFYFKNSDDVENAVKWVNKQQKRYEEN